MKKNFKNIIPVLTVVVAAAALVVLNFCDVRYSSDEALNALISDVVIRLITVAAMVVIILFIGCKQIFIPQKIDTAKKLLWCVPCLLVVLANFPFTALIGGKAQILRFDLLFPFAVDCILIGLTEEILFRGLVQYAVLHRADGKKTSAFATIAITSALFGLIHLFNLFSGSSFPATLLQVGYSFLLGAMLSAVMLKTNDIWICVFLHACFDFGGNIVTTTGSGPFQDMWFWIFTAIAGIICFAHVLYFIIKSDRPIKK